MLKPCRLPVSLKELPEFLMLLEKRPLPGLFLHHVCAARLIMYAAPALIKEAGSRMVFSMAPE